MADRLQRLAELSVHGANVQPGQIVMITAEIGQEEQARTLAAATGAQLRLDNSVGPSLVLILGDDFTQVTAVHVGSSGSTGGSASSSASSGTSTAPSTAPTTSTPAQPSSNAATAGTCSNPIY